MRAIKVKAVIITDGEHYLIHGSDGVAPQQMFEAMLPIWKLDPSKETVHCVELDVILPEFEKLDAPTVTE